MLAGSRISAFLALSVASTPLLAQSGGTITGSQIEAAPSLTLLPIGIALALLGSRTLRKLVVRSRLSAVLAIAGLYANSIVKYVSPWH